MGPVPVTLTTVAPKPVDRTTDYVATLRSRRSSEIRPQVDGVIRRIFIRSGQRVAEGTPLIQIDPGKQQAAVSSSEASRRAQEATVRYAQEQRQRAEGLFKEGLVSKQELDRATADLDSAEAALRALEARERESRVELGYYTVAATTAGFVGDVPVRVGDRVETSTVLTTIDQQAGLEAYIHVPVERAPGLKAGLTVRLLDDAGQVLETQRIDFVSPQVDQRMQTVLVKTPVSAGKGFRTEQFVRAQIVWSSEPALTVPALSVTRVNGQYFSYVAEQKDAMLVARQRLIRLGELVGNEYIVLDGLKPGERVVTSGIQRLGDGVPVAPAS
jgi:RND family efflux transporter MFP subunit